MDLEKIGKKKVVTILEQEGVGDAARLMRENHVGDIIVVEEHNHKMIPIGMVTDRDIVMATLAVGASPDPFTVGDVMTTNLVTVRENETLNHVIDLMKVHGIKRLPIIGKNQELLGIIAVEDIMSFLSSELSALSEVSQRQKEVEFQRRRVI